MKNKRILLISIILITLLGIFLITSSRPRTDVFLGAFKVSEDGKTMELKVGVSSSAGYIRKMKKTSGSTNGYYTFYSTFGINSRLGAKNTFNIELDDNMDEIYFYKGNKGYKLVLIKNTVTNEWEKINYTANNMVKPKLLDRQDIIKIEIDTYSQNNNYLEFTNKNTIDKIYNIFDDLETKAISKTYNPENPEEMYKIKFIYDKSLDIYSNKPREDSHFEVYKKDNKYYAEQSYNGIYEINKEDFNLIKSYIK